MSTTSNLVLKNAAGADVTFINATGATGVSSAVWHLQVGPNRAAWPKVEASSVKSGDSRKVKWTLTVPAIATDPSGVARVVAKDFTVLEHITPALVPTSVSADAIAYAESLTATDAFQVSLETGYAP